jgi:hypothetical protein
MDIGGSARHFGFKDSARSPCVLAHACDGLEEGRFASRLSFARRNGRNDSLPLVIGLVNGGPKCHARMRGHGGGTGTWNVRRKSSDQEIYFEVFLGLPLSSAGAGAAGEGTTSLREVACDESTPKYLTVCLLGVGTKAARRAIRASGGSSTDQVPSDHGLLKSRRRVS